MWAPWRGFSSPPAAWHDCGADVPFSHSAPRSPRRAMLLPVPPVASSARAWRWQSRGAGRAPNIRLPRGWCRVPTGHRDAARWASTTSRATSAKRRCRPQSRFSWRSCRGAMRCGSSAPSALPWRRPSRSTCRPGPWLREKLFTAPASRRGVVSPCSFVSAFWIPRSGWASSPICRCSSRRREHPCRRSDWRSPSSSSAAPAASSCADGWAPASACSGPW
jgi:hypothetical protein